jgi:hypothetical protein
MLTGVAQWEREQEKQVAKLQTMAEAEPKRLKLRLGEADAGVANTSPSKSAPAKKQSVTNRKEGGAGIALYVACNAPNSLLPAASVRAIFVGDTIQVPPPLGAR